MDLPHARLIRALMHDRRRPNLDAIHHEADGRAEPAIGPLASGVRDMPRGLSLTTAFPDPSRNQFLVGASLDKQLGGLLLSELIRTSLGESERKAPSLGQQV